MGVLPVLATALALLLSSHAPHARSVGLTLTFHYEMQCGYPGSDALVLHVPQRVPKHLARKAVLLDGKPVPAVTVLGHRVTLRMPTRPMIMCDSIGPGRLTIAFMRAAHLTNPVAGRYRVVATKGTMRFTAPIAIR